MPPLTTIALVLLTLCSLVTAVYWGAMLVHFALTSRQIPTARDGLRHWPAAIGGSDRGAPRVCIIVPAHNEEAVIGNLAASLAAQDYPRDRLHLVFALDRCTDGTRGVIEQAMAAAGDVDRAEIIEVTHCPEGWTGKVHAVWSAVRGSRHVAALGPSDVLLFADADTTFDPACTRAAVALMRERRLDMLSLLSTQRVGSWFEWVVQPAACLELVRQYPLRRANSETRRRPFANGQFIMFTREAYERIGGHEPVKDEPLEDVHISRLAHAKGLRLGLFLADGMMFCRMYRDWPSFERGWKRIFIECANRKVSRLKKVGWRLRLLGAALPAAAAVGAVWAGVLWAGAAPGESGLLAPIVCILSLVALAAYGAGVVLTCRASRTPLAAAAAFPAGAWLAGGLILRAAADLASGKPMLWGGREYHRARR